jgi:4'-phosphopantetheinyl transferase
MAIQSVTPLDFEKSSRFRYKDDQMATLVSRLFLRQTVRRFVGAPWHEIDFERTEKGKPYLVKPEGCTFGLNSSHQVLKFLCKSHQLMVSPQGDYTVFSSSCTQRVGVDVMRLDMCSEYI